MCTEADTMKLEAEMETCCVCSATDEELFSPEEHDAGAAPGLVPLRAMLLHLSHNKVVPNGRLCSNCIRRTQDSYNFSTALSTKGSPPLSEKITSLRKRLHELTQKIDVFIVVGGGGEGGGEGAYSEDDIIMVERAALEAGLRAERRDAARGEDARGEPVYQCSVCPASYARAGELRAHQAQHPPGAPHACWTCGARLPDAAAAARHAASHAAPRPNHCNLCDTTFQSQAEFRRHEAACPAACPACGLRAGARGALRAHAARAARCAVCDECFLPCGARAELAAHKLAHRRDKHFVCGYKACILRFHTRTNLLAHIRKCHGGGDLLEPAAPAPAAAAPAPAPAACPRCPRVFGSAAALKRHARAHRDPAATEADAEWGEGMAEAEGEGEGGARVEYLEMDALDDTLA